MTLHPFHLDPIREMLRLILAELKKINEREDKKVQVFNISMPTAALYTNTPPVRVGDSVNWKGHKWEVSKVDGGAVHLKRQVYDYIGSYWLARVIDAKDVVPWI